MNRDDTQEMLKHWHNSEFTENSKNKMEFWPCTTQEKNPVWN